MGFIIQEGLSNDEWVVKVLFIQGCNFSLISYFFIWKPMKIIFESSSIEHVSHDFLGGSLFSVAMIHHIQGP